MADEPGRNKQPYEKIAPLVPEEASDEQIDKNNEPIQRVIQGQIGKQIYNRDGTAATRWIAGVPYLKRNVGGVVKWANFDDKDPDGVTFYDLDQGPIHAWLGGDTYHNRIVDLRNKIPVGENPLTKENWKTPVDQASYGELVAYDRMVQRSQGLHEPDAGEVDGLTRSNTVANLLRDISNRYNAIGGQDGLSLYNQAVQAIRTDTAFDQWAHQSKDSNRLNYLYLMRDLTRLQSAGVNVNDFAKANPNNAAGSVVSTVLQGTGMLHPLLGLVTGSALETAKALNDNKITADAFSNLVPEVRAEVDQSLYNHVKNRASGKYGDIRFSDDVRKYGQDAADDLYGPLDIGSGEGIPQRSKSLEQTAADKAAADAGRPDTTQSGLTNITAQPRGAGGIHTIIETPQDDAIAKAVARGDMTAAEAQAMRDRIVKANQPAVNQPVANQPRPAPITLNPLQVAPLSVGTIPGAKPQSSVQVVNPNATPTPSPAPTATPEFNPAHPSRTPKPAVAGTALNESELPPNAEMGAPLGSPDYQMPHLFRQEHVDSLPSGTPFLWADHPNPYVRT